MVILYTQCQEEEEGFVNYIWADGLYYTPSWPCRAEAWLYCRLAS